MDATLSPCKGKSFKEPGIYKAFALTGRLADCLYTQGVALGYELLPLQGVLLNEYTHKDYCLNSFNSFNSLTPLTPLTP